MTLNARLYKLYERTNKPIGYFGNAAAILSLLGSAAIWFSGNLDRLWPFVAITAVVASVAMAARMYYMQMQIIEKDKAFNSLMDIKGQDMVSDLRARVASKPEIVSIAELTSAIHLLGDAGADKKAVDDLLFLVSELEKLQRQQKPDN